MGDVIVSSAFRSEMEACSGFTSATPDALHGRCSCWEAEAKEQRVAEAARRPRHQKKVKLCDLARLKSRKEEVKKKLKEMTKELKIQVQKRRRLLRKAGNLDEEDLAWLQEQAKEKKKNEQEAAQKNSA